MRSVLRIIVLIGLQSTSLALAQRAPVSPDRPWHGLGEAKIEADARNLTGPDFNFDPEKNYSLPELINLAESHNPETRAAWERASRCLGVAHSEIYPTVAAAHSLGLTANKSTWRTVRGRDGEDGPAHEGSP